jgi:hypothetical protein
MPSLPRPLRDAALAGLSLGALLALAAPAAQARPRPLSCANERGALRLCGAITDNYKDCYNPIDGQRETRTWLQARAVRARGANWRIVSGQGQFGAAMRLVKYSGNAAMPARATLSVAATSGGASTSELRNGLPAGRFGPFLQLRSAATLDTAPVRVRLVLRGPGGARIATSVVEYRRDASLYRAAADSPEANGPGGRWYVGGVRTPTDIEVGMPASCSHPAG